MFLDPTVSVHVKLSPPAIDVLRFVRPIRLDLRPATTQLAEVELPGPVGHPTAEQPTMGAPGWSTAMTVHS